MVVQIFQGRDGFLFLVGLAELVAGDVIIGDDEAMAEQRGPAELAHERLRELLEGVGEDDDLHERAEFAEKFRATWQRRECGDDGLDVGELEAVAVEDREPAGHELVVVRFVARGAAEFRDAGFFGDGDQIGRAHV